MRHSRGLRSNTQNGGMELKPKHRLAAIVGPLAARLFSLMWPLAASAVVVLTYDDTLKDIKQTAESPLRHRQPIV